jgi:hypothetical protein
MRLSPRFAVAVLTAALLASCASPPPEPIPVAVVPPAAPPPPPVAMPASLIESAGAYRMYMQKASEISPAFADGAAVEQSLTSAVAYEPKQLLRGAIAYAALVALQSPQFVAGVRTYAVDPAQRRDMAARLIADPNYASALPSAASAAGLVQAALAADAAKVRKAGELVKQAAYDVQHQSWSKADIVGRDARLANAKTLSSQSITPPADDVQLLRTAINGRDDTGVSPLSVTGDPLAPPYTPVVLRGLTLAALAALGEANDANLTALEPLTQETSSAFCLNMSKLNVYQCLSVAKPYYEDVFCLGQHILLDTAQCVAKAAGQPRPIAVADAAPPPPPVQSSPTAATGSAPATAKP